MGRAEPPGSSGQPPALKHVLAAMLQLLCYTVAWGLIFIAILFQVLIVAIPFWTWDWRYASNPWQKFRDVVYIKYGMTEDTKLFESWDSLMLAFTWLPPLVAIIVAMVPTLLLSKGLLAAAWQCEPMSTMKSAGRKVVRYCSYPMWPHKFWLWWCNGFSVWDAFMMATFLMAHVVSIWQMTEWYKRRYPGWDALGLAYSQPKSVYNLEWISLAFAWVLYVDLTFIFFPVAHLSVLHSLLGSSWSAVVKYHRWLGHFGMWTVTGHALFYYWYWLANSELNFWNEFFDWNTKSSINFFAGSISWLSGVALWVTSINWVRRRFFKVFYNTHLIGAACFVVFAHVHYYWTWIYLAPGMIAWGLDIVFRVFQAQHVSVVSSAQLTPSGKLAQLEIPLDRHMVGKISAGQDVFLQFPDVSRWSWHPFTIYKVNIPTQADVLPSMTIAIKQYGRWTKVLLSKLQHGCCLPVRLVGPVGRLHKLGTHISSVVMFVGGIGASPALAHLNHMIEADKRVPTTVVYVARDQEEFTMLDEQLLAEASRTDWPWLKLKLYCTSNTSASIAPALAGQDSIQKLHDAHVPPSPAAAAAIDSGAAAAKSGLKTSASCELGYMPDAAPGKQMLSSFGWNAIRPMQPRLLNNWHLLLAICVAWLGGFLGAVQAQSGVIEKWYPGWTDHDGWAMGLMFVACIGVQAVGLPAVLVVFPVHLYRYWRSSKVMSCPVAAPTSPSITVLGGSKVGITETALSLPLAHGRPDIAATLQEAVQGSSADEVAVIVAGPTGMLHEVERAVWAANWKRNTTKLPFLHIIRETYEM